MGFEAFGKNVEAFTEGIGKALEGLQETLIGPLLRAFDMSKWFGANGAPGVFSTFTDMLSGLSNTLTGKETKNATFTHPIAGQSVLSSGFGPRGHRQHRGVDLAAPQGTPIQAWSGGKVSFVGFDKNGYGNYVIIEHPDGRTTRYGHMRAIHVQTGQEVFTGTKIGTVGNTGRSTGPHLHFEIRDSNGVAQNPEHICQNESGFSLKKSSA